MDKIIYRTITLDCNPQKAFKLFTENQHLKKWLTQVAEVEPKVGGKYELFWNPDDRENDSTIGCKILAITPSSFLCFGWKGPKKFKHFMNNVTPLTNVTIAFIPNPKGTEIHLLHSGWRNTADWEKARECFNKAWATALSKLQRYTEETNDGNI